MEKELLLVGLGNMGKEYSKVLKALDTPFIAVGRGLESAADYESVTGIKPVTGGIENYLSGQTVRAEQAIVAVDVTLLYNTVTELLKAGVRRILVEKPGALHKNQLLELRTLADRMGAEVFIAYNRRFYESVRAARKIIATDGGVDSFMFEFTEWSHRIEPLAKDMEEKERWFLSNSSHVADMAFFIGGRPKALEAWHSGSLSWHKSASCFAGSGISKTGALFSYMANWDAPGRWGVEVMTRNFRLIFRPLEKLQIQKRGSISIDDYDIDDTLDVSFKPGLCRMTEAFLSGDISSLCSLEDQIDAFDMFMKIANYN